MNNILNKNNPFLWANRTRAGYVAQKINGYSPILFDFKIENILTSKVFCNLNSLKTIDQDNSENDEVNLQFDNDNYIKYSVIFEDDLDYNTYIGLINRNTGKIITEPIWDNIYRIGKNVFAGELYNFPNFIYGEDTFYILFDSNGNIINY